MYSSQRWTSFKTATQASCAKQQQLKATMNTDSPQTINEAQHANLNRYGQDLSRNNTSHELKQRDLQTNNKCWEKWIGCRTDIIFVLLKSRTMNTLFKDNSTPPAVLAHLWWFQFSPRCFVKPLLDVVTYKHCWIYLKVKQVRDLQPATFSFKLLLWTNTQHTQT